MRFCYFKSEVHGVEWVGIGYSLWSLTISWSLVRQDPLPQHFNTSKLIFNKQYIFSRQPLQHFHFIQRFNSFFDLHFSISVFCPDENRIACQQQALWNDERPFLFLNDNIGFYGETGKSSREWFCKIGIDPQGLFAGINEGMYLAHRCLEHLVGKSVDLHKYSLAI